MARGLGGTWAEFPVSSVVTCHVVLALRPSCLVRGCTPAAVGRFAADEVVRDHAFALGLDAKVRADVADTGDILGNGKGQLDGCGADRVDARRAGTGGGAHSI